MDLPHNEPHSPLTGRRVAHYRFQELVGRGGMGDVYRAEDEKLRRDVAIKVLPSHLAEDDNSRRRFIRETRLASKVVHPYVATVFDVVEDKDDLFLVMEFIEGKRLSQVLRESSLDLDRALSWGVEIAEALTTIHAAGLIHRDLKPGNVMITTDGHTKLMDFGLARGSSPRIDPRGPDGLDDATITAAGAGVGTILYMSPEQLCGERADQRSDLFSFGILMYEAVTGVHPFEQGTIRETARAILEDPPGAGSDPDTLTSSGPLRDVLHRCLEKRPDRRYQSSPELLAELRATSQSLKGVRLWSPSTRRSITVLGVITAVLVSLAAGGSYWLTRPPNWERPRFSVAVAPFVDRTGDADGESRAGMVSDLLTTDLESSRVVRAVGPDRTGVLISGVGEDASSQEIARRISSGTLVDYVLTGSLYREDGRYLATVEIHAADPARPTVPGYRAEAVSLLALAENLASGMRRRLPEVSALTAWKDDRTDLGRVTSESEEAILHFELGRIALADGRFDLAAEEFQAATEIDSGFAAAHAWLAQALDRAGYARRAREVAATALDLAPPPDSRAAERLGLFIRATWAQVYGRAEERIETTGLLANLFPDEPWILQMNAEALFSIGDISAAEKRLDQALAIDERSGRLHLLKADMQMLARDLEGSRESLARAAAGYREIEYHLGQANIDVMEGRILAQEERYEEASAALTAAAAVFAAEGNEFRAAEVHLEIANIALTRGRPVAAAEPLVSALAAARRAGNRALECRAMSSEGTRLFLTGNFAEAEAPLRDASDLARQLENDQLLTNPLSNLASMLTYMGRVGEARGMLEEALAVARRTEQINTEIQMLFMLADAEYQLGNVREGMQTYQEALAVPQKEGTDRIRAWVHVGLAEVYERQGKLRRSLEATGHALSEARRLGDSNIEGYALVRQGQLSATIGRQKASVHDLDEADAIAKRDNFADVLLRCNIARGYSMGYQGRWVDAIRYGETADIPTAAPAVAIAARTLICEGFLEDGRPDAALEVCRRAVETAQAPLPEIVHARSVLGEALLQTGNHRDALEAAITTMKEARVMELSLPLARAAATVLSLPDGIRPPDAEEIRVDGNDAIQSYLDAAPDDARAQLDGRSDIRRILTRLTKANATNPQT